MTSVSTSSRRRRQRQQQQQQQQQRQSMGTPNDREASLSTAGPSLTRPPLASSVVYETLPSMVIVLSLMLLLLVLTVTNISVSVTVDAYIPSVQKHRGWTPRWRRSSTCCSPNKFQHSQSQLSLKQQQQQLPVHVAIPAAGMSWSRRRIHATLSLNSKPNDDVDESLPEMYDRIDDEDGNNGCNEAQNDDDHDEDNDEDEELVPRMSADVRGRPAGVVLEDLDWRVMKLKLEEENTRRFLKAGPRFLPYDEARQWVQAWGQRWTSESEWHSWIEKGEKRNSYIPSRPDEYYTRRGSWISWAHFLGVDEEPNGDVESSKD